jgi:hypothetical protein
MADAMTGYFLPVTGWILTVGVVATAWVIVQRMRSRRIP